MFRPHYEDMNDVMTNASPLASGRAKPTSLGERTLKFMKSARSYCQSKPE